MGKLGNGGYDDPDQKSKSLNQLFEDFKEPSPPLDLERIEVLKKGAQTEILLSNRLKNIAKSAKKGDGFER